MIFVVIIYRTIALNQWLTTLPSCGACAINAKKYLPVLFLLSLTLAACGGTVQNFATSTPIPTSTPRATLLPTIATEVPFGSADHPYTVLLVPPATSSETGTALAAFLKDRTGLTFKVNIVQNYSDVLAALCSPTPTFGWVDGWTVFAAMEQGCGTVALRIKQGDATGVKSDMVVSVAGAVDSVATLRRAASRRDFCRLGSQDTISWILPVVMLRAPGFNPLKDFRNVKDYSDPSAMMQDVSDNKCIAAIASGTLSSYKANNVADITKTVKVFATSPELPFGGLMISPTVPRGVADQVIKQFADHPDQLKDLVPVDSLIPASNADFADAQKAFDTAGMNFDVLGQ